MQEYYQNEPRFNGVFSRYNLPNTIKNGAYVINLDEYCDIGTPWVSFYVNNKTITYICGYFCIGFINFMFNGNSLTDHTNLFSPSEQKKTMIKFLSILVYRM